MLGWMRAAGSIAGIAASLLVCDLAADEKPGEVGNDVQRAFYNGLVERGVHPAIAEVMTIDTEIVAMDEGQLHLVQTMIGGGRREVILHMQPPADSGPLVPLMLDDGRVVRASGVTVIGPPGGYRMELGFVAPGEPEAPQFGYSYPLEFIGELLGIAEAQAQFSAPEMAISLVDSFNAPVQSNGTAPSAGPQNFTDAATEALTSPTGDLVEAANDVRDAMQGTSAPTSVLGKIAEGAKSAAGVIKHAAGTFKAYQDYKAKEAMLAAAYDCAEHPTEPTAIDAMRNDPNYHRATTERIKAARNELKLHYGIKIFTSTANQVASTLLDATGTPAGKAWSKVTGLLDKSEDAMLNHVEEEYILKDATRGVVPCRNTCEPVYQPAPQPEALASYPPADMSCDNPAPEQLVCSAGPPAPASSSLPPPAPPPASLTCGVLTSAVFTYTNSYSASGCYSVVCESTSRETRFQGTAALTAVGTKGYDGTGSGHWDELESSETEITVSAPCAHTSTVSHTAGTGDLTITARFSIATQDVGGLDTGGMSADTTVVEIMLGGEVPYDSTNSGCEGVTRDSGTVSLGMDCHFYGVDLYRAGFYKVYKDGEPGSGECTLSLSR